LFGIIKKVYICRVKQKQQIKPNKMKKFKNLLTKINKVLTNLGAGASYAIRH